MHQQQQQQQKKSINTNSLYKVNAILNDIS